MPAAGARRIVARDLEVRGSEGDDDAAEVAHLRRAVGRAEGHLEVEPEEPVDRVVKSRRVVFAAASFGDAARDVRPTRGARTGEGAHQPR